MSDLTLRNEYYFENGHVALRRAQRPNKYARWHRGGNHAQLVATIEQHEDRMAITKGPACTDDRLREALLLEQGMGNLANSDMGSRIPVGILSSLREHVDGAVQETIPQFRAFSNEERETGALFGRLERTWDTQGWKVSISTQGFSSAGKNAKETKVGADIGIRVDIASDSGRTVKALLVQAKRRLAPIDNANALLDNDGQIGKMMSITAESYVIVYTPHEIYLVSPSTGERLSLSDLMVDALSCDRGDRNPNAIVNTLDRDFVLFAEAVQRK